MDNNTARSNMRSYKKKPRRLANAFCCTASADDECAAGVLQETHQYSMEDKEILRPVTINVDSMAPQGVTARRDGIVKIQEEWPNLRLRGVGGVVPVEALVTVGIYFYPVGSEKLCYIEIADFLYAPKAEVELYPTRAAFMQLAATHHFDDVCEIHFPDGIRLPFMSTPQGYMFKAFYGGMNKLEVPAYTVVATPNARVVNDTPLVALDVPYILYICSGERREGDFTQEIENISDLHVINVDIKIGGRHHDVTKEDVAQRLVDIAGSQQCKGILASVPCSTWSAARFNEKECAPILRNLDHPCGIPGTDGELPASVKEANCILDATIKAVWAVTAHGGSYIFESPVSRCKGSPHAIPGREQHAAMWTYPRMLELARAYRSLSVCFDRCRVGCETQKTTELLASPSIFDEVVWRFGTLRCNHVECRRHSLLNSAVGTRSSETYSQHMNSLLASCFEAACNPKRVEQKSPQAVTTPTRTVAAMEGVPEQRPPLGNVATVHLPERRTPRVSTDIVWRRLAYPAAEAWRRVPEVLNGTGLAPGVPPHRDPSKVPAVASGRMRAHSFPGGAFDAPNRLLQIVYMDFTGPFRTPSVIDGFQHYCGVVDAWSGYARIFACHGQTANVARDSLAQFIADVRSRANHAPDPVAVVRTDQGSAFTSKVFTEYVRHNVGAVLSFACTYTPQQNSYAERLWLNVGSTARVLLAAGGLPPSFHFFASQTACYLRNRMPSSTRGMRSPYMMIAGTPADVSRLRAFGCLTHVYHPASQRPLHHSYEAEGKKLTPRATPGVYLGPSETSPGSNVYLRSSTSDASAPKVVTTAHVQFCETVFPGDTDISFDGAPPPPSRPLQDKESDSDGSCDDVYSPPRKITPEAATQPTSRQNVRDSEISDTEEQNQIPATLENEFEEIQRTAVLNAKAGICAKKDEALLRAEDDPGSVRYDRQHPSRTRTPTAHYNPEEEGNRPQRRQMALTDSDGENDEREAVSFFTDPTVCSPADASKNHAMLTGERHSDSDFAYWSAVGYAAIVQPTLDLGDIVIPTSYKNALSSTHKDYWRAAITKEVTGLLSLDTWTPELQSNVPSGCNVVNCHYVFALKRKADGSVDKFKARLVADGNTQRHGIDYDRVFSTVVKMSTLRMLLIQAVASEYHLTSVDIRQAFLQADLANDQPIFMRMPPGLPRCDKHGQPLVVRLNKTLYGLKQAGREFNILLVEFLAKLGFVRSNIDTCLFIRSNDEPMYLAVWVDDIVIAAKSHAAHRHFVKQLEERFPIEDKGPLQWILGMQVTHKRQDREISLSQGLYIQDILSKYAPFLTDSCRSYDVPMAEAPLLTEAMSPIVGTPEHDRMRGKQEFYMTVVGCLLWLAACTRPDIAYASSVVARYVANPGIEHYNALIRILVYLRTTSKHGLKFRVRERVGLYVYADANWCTKFSTSGALYYLHGCLFAWYSRLQRSVCHSTAEAEYISASSAARDAIFHRDVLHDLGGLDPGPTPLLLDSKSAIDMAFDPVAFKKTKHALRDAHFLRDVVAREILRPQHVSSEEELADVMSKAVTRSIYLRLRPMLVEIVEHSSKVPSEDDEEKEDKTRVQKVEEVPGDEDHG